MTQDTRKNVVINVEGMHCENCVAKVRKALAALPGVEVVNVNLEEKVAQVRFDPAAVKTAGLMQAVRGAGFVAAGFAAA